jgi:hemoglobin-like flavoprotein
MNRDQVHLIRSTADALLSGGRVADSFYEALFTTAPETRRLFRDDLTAQKLKFLDMLASLVGAVDQPAMFRSILTHLGRRHGRYGVQAGHYDAVRTALMTSLKEILGDRLTPAVRDAWMALYHEAQDTMLEGARTA